MLMKSILLAVLLSCLFVACDYGSGRITLASNSLPLTFDLHGTDQVQWVWITGPYPNEREPAPKLPPAPGPKEYMIWRIAPAREFPSMDDIPQITYGQTPDGWRQEIPEAGAPPPLLDGYVYHIRAIPVRRENTLLCVYVKGGQLQPYKSDTQDSECK